MSDARPLAIVAAALIALAGADATTKERLSQWLYPPKPVVIATPQPAPEPPPPVVEPVVEPPPTVVVPPVVTPDPPPKPKAKPKPKLKPVKRWPGSDMPSCAEVRRQYQRMSYAQQLAAYSRATPAQVAHGKRCLGM